MYAADARHSDPGLEEKLKYLYTLRGGPAIDLTIRPAYYELLARLGDPHEKLPPLIHVAGTNGKGSTVATMRAVCEAAGRTVHAYTSPHLARFNERIVLAGREIGDRDLEALLDEAVAATGDLPLTFFEITTALAFATFARVPADILLLETGLGGRLDCTNVVEKPLAAVITPLGLDHAEYLGDTVAAIAGEKAGIMKQGVPCVIAPQDDAAADAALTERAARLPCPLYRHGRDWRIGAGEGSMSMAFGAKKFSLPLPALAGRHQIVNAGTALAGLLAAGLEIPEPSMAQGLMNVRWPGRLQRVEQFALPPGWELWIDGGHNAHAARALAEQAALWRQDGKPLHLVVGMLDKRDPLEFVNPLAPFCASITAVPITGEPQSHAPAALMERLASGANFPLIHPAADPREAVASLPRLHEKPGRVLVTGSLYLMRFFQA